MFNGVITTMNKYHKDVISGGIIDVAKREGNLKEYQTVVAIGDIVKGVKVGDVICINPTRYAIKKHQEGSLKDGIIEDNPVERYNFNVIEFNGESYLRITDQDIDYIIEEYENEVGD